MLNHKKNALPLLLAIVGVCGFSTANAASFAITPAATVGVTGGATSPATLSVNFTGDAVAGPTAVIGYQTDISFDNTQMSVALTNGNADSCVLFDANTIRIQDVDPTLTLLGSGTACSLAFTVNNPQVGGTVYALAFEVGQTLCSNASAGNETCATTDGSITVVVTSPEFNVNPAIANPLVFTGLISTNIDQTITVENIGDAGTNLTLTGTITGPQFSIVSGLPNNAPGIGQGTSANIVLRCNSAAAGTFNDTLVLTTNDPDDGEGTVNIPVQCNVSAAPTPELEATFNAVAVADGGSVTMSAPQNTSIQQVLSFGNSGTAALSIGAVSGLSGVLSATAPSSASVATGVTAGGAGASNITVTCNPGVTASTVQTISVVNNDGDENPFDVTIDCQAVLAAVPVVNPAAIGIVGAPSVIAAGSTTLSNTGGLQLDVASCVVPVGFTLDAPAAVPFSVPAGGNTTVTVSCTTPAAGAAPITGDLVCQSNGLANGGVITIPLSCSGTPLVVPVMSNMGKILLASLVIGLGLLGMGLRRQG